MSNLDRFYGVVADIRDALVLSGSWSWENRDALFEAGNELISIAERTRNLFLGLPTGATLPRLPEPTSE